MPDVCVEYEFVWPDGHVERAEDTEELDFIGVLMTGAILKRVFINGVECPKLLKKATS